MAPDRPMAELGSCMDRPAVADAWFEDDYRLLRTHRSSDDVIARLRDSRLEPSGALRGANAE